MDNFTNTKKITLTALFAALTCVATMIIKVPTPGTEGYIHLGDSLVILSGIVLGPLYGALAAGIGSAMSDLIGGYFMYVPITFIVKGVIGLTVALIYRHLPASFNSTVKCIICGIDATVIVAAGYLFFELFMYGAGAVASVPANIVQGISGLVISTLVLPIINRIVKTQAGNVA